MRRVLLMSGALVALSCAPALAANDESVPPRPVGEAGTVLLAQAEVGGEVDAGKLIGADVVDANGDKVGEIDSVMVDPQGEVKSVVIDVSGWLESEKLVSVDWSDLKMGEDGKIVTSLTKESAEAATAYDYKDPALRGQVMTESGEPYTAADTGKATPETTATADVDADAGSPISNADGSLNASKLIGLEVKSPDDNKVGDIGEVILDKGGEVQGVVVDVGGFLGIASRPVLLDWQDVELAEKDGKATAIVNVSKERLEQMPAYESSKD